MRLGVICPSEIASRRFMPALQQSNTFSFVGVGYYTEEERRGSRRTGEMQSAKELASNAREKAQRFADQFGGVVFEGYEAVVKSPLIDAVYIPLPPALHYKWARMALNYGKHVLLEKPFTTSLDETNDLLDTAAVNHLAVHENYMYVFHNQIAVINKTIEQGAIGDVRLYRICFGFPRRPQTDFRYDKLMGGGALLDAGGYTLHYASKLLGPTAKLTCAKSNYIDGFDVDIYGSATLINEEGVTAQVAFGMDNNYKCELEVWGSVGCLTTKRVLTAPPGFIPTMTISRGSTDEIIELPADDTFLKSINYFAKCIENESLRLENYNTIKKQAHLVESFKQNAGWTEY